MNTPLLGRGGKAAWRRRVTAAAITAAVCCVAACVAVSIGIHSQPTALLKSSPVDGCSMSEQDYAARLAAGEVSSTELQIRHYFEAADTDHSGMVLFFLHLSFPHYSGLAANWTCSWNLSYV